MKISEVWRGAPRIESEQRYHTFILSVVFLLYNSSMVNDTYTRYEKMFAENSGILRASAAVELGVPRHIIYRMLEKGLLIREAQGIYRLPGSDLTANPDLVKSACVYHAVICLISALYFHELTTQIPHQIHIALPRNVKTPKIIYPPIKTFHYSGRAYEEGIEEHFLDGVKTRIYSREKTIADCFKFREKIGPDIALEALKDYLKQPRANIQLVIKYARVDRVDKVMRPYLESLI